MMLYSVMGILGGGGGEWWDGYLEIGIFSLGMGTKFSAGVALMPISKSVGGGGE